MRNIHVVILPEARAATNAGVGIRHAESSQVRTSLAHIQQKIQVLVNANNDYSNKDY